MNRYLVVRHGVHDDGCYEGTGGGNSELYLTYAHKAYGAVQHVADLLNLDEYDSPADLYAIKLGVVQKRESETRLVTVDDLVHLADSFDTIKPPKRTKPQGSLALSPFMKKAMYALWDDGTLMARSAITFGTANLTVGDVGIVDSVNDIIEKHRRKKKEATDGRTG